MNEFLKEEKVNPSLIEAAEAFRKKYPVPEESEARIPRPKYRYYGTSIWEMAITAILSGKNLLLAGPKATGKNVLCENLAQLFGRPSYDISFHVNTDAVTLIGGDTFRDGNVVFRAGPVMSCASCGGFGVLDEINMAKNEAVSVLHGVLDYRRIIDVPGYDRIKVHEAARFLATMNYGYAGTRELNEALASRFVVIAMPFISPEGLQKLIRRQFPSLQDPYPEQLGKLFFDIKAKSDSGEISEKPLDLRGLLDAIELMRNGLEANLALDMGITNKSFDPFERKLVRDMIRGRIPKKLSGEKMFRA